MRCEPSAEVNDDALVVSGLQVCYGPVTAVSDVGLLLQIGETRAIVGQNGAGKSSLLRAICGLITPRAGCVELCGADVTRTPTQERARLGITLVPEGRGVFGSMSVRDNIAVAVGRSRGATAAVDQYLEMFPTLQPLAGRMAAMLSGGEQQLLALARALATKPRILLLDEPSMGLSPLAVEVVFDVLANLGTDGPGVLIVEQNVRLATELASFVYVMQRGVVVAEGPSTIIAGDSRVTDAYLGGAATSSPRP